ncbi:GntR family transcriptional regulator [Bacillus sp. ISL-18]|uniref:GntR family transcriptional regulator n=1 Tax=Bacillus sp. ISL-18 TaxID=2819118 RepID=UPI001BE878A8|nr:GntR family transcriptional regulator [Bacillus sp. ISL-18]MBT2654432.1 GntR family transcriptional regulator [Bacillus sp. ISL-18]
MLNSSQMNRRLSTKDFVYFEIKKKIIEGILAPDQPINEEYLATELNISRTPIREALQRLEIEELIQRLPNGRLKVAPISIQEVEEIFHVRSLLEGLIAREATTKATANDIQKLGQFTQLIVTAANNDRGEEVVYYGSEFHSYLYQISKNKTANKILNQLNDHISRYRRLGPIKNNERSRKAAKEHQEMFEAISNKNPDKAEKLMREHINNSLKAAVHTIEVHLQQNIDENN